MATEIRVPTLGESVTEATIGQWFKKEGEAVKADEPLVELETDKVTIEVPAPSNGVLSAIKVKTGDTVEVGALSASIAEGAGAATAKSNGNGADASKAAKPAAAKPAPMPKAEAKPAAAPAPIAPKAAPEQVDPAVSAPHRRRDRSRHIEDRRHRQRWPHHQSRCARRARENGRSAAPGNPSARARARD